jgi:hypothetical protein
VRPDHLDDAPQGPLEGWRLGYGSDRRLGPVRDHPDDAPQGPLEGWHLGYGWDRRLGSVRTLHGTLAMTRWSVVFSSLVRRGVALRQGVPVSTLASEPAKRMRLQKDHRRTFLSALLSKNEAWLSCLAVLLGI